MDNKIREQTQSHMKKLLARAVGGAAVALGTCGSSSPPIVCDPLPPPACNEYSTQQSIFERIAHSAKWQLVKDKLLIVVTLKDYYTGIEFSELPMLWNAKLVGNELAEGSITFSFVPGRRAKIVDADLPVKCGALSKLKLRFEVSSHPSDGLAVPMSLRD